MEVAGNRLTLLADGPGRLEALIALIDGAEESLRVLYYIWGTTRPGARVRDALVRGGASAACRCRCSSTGSAPRHAEGFFRPLIDAQARFCRFVPRWGRRYLLRNHQKLALADGRRAIIGGFNISNDYFGTIEDGAWRDLGLHVEGDSVEFLVGYFDACSPGRESPTPRSGGCGGCSADSVTDGLLHWLFGGPTRRLSPWARSVRRDMKRARAARSHRRLYRAGPLLMRRVGNVARRRGGSGSSRRPRSIISAAVGAARHTYWLLLEARRRIYEYQADQATSSSSSWTTSSISARPISTCAASILNLEMMLRVDDPGFAAAMRGSSTARSPTVEITFEAHRASMTWCNRLKWALGYFLMAIADYESRGG